MLFEISGDGIKNMDTNQQNPQQDRNTHKRVPIFNITPLTNVSAKASKTPKKPKATVTVKIRKKPSQIDLKYADIHQVGENYVFNAETGSIQEYINLCHPDIRTLINNNEITSVKAEVGNLIVVTRNDLRISIKNTGKYEREITIKDKRNVIYKGKSTVTFAVQKKLS